MGLYGDCKVGTGEESSSNLLQGEAGSDEVRRRATPGATPTLLPFGVGGENRAAALPLKPKHLWRVGRNAEAGALSLRQQQPWPTQSGALRVF